MLNWIEVATMFITAFAAVSSIIIAILTLKQNSKMIEDNTRPYIVIYKDTIDINSPTEYIVIENFGNSAGTITNLEYDKELLKSLFNKTAIDLNLLSYLSNITLVPHQRYLFPIKSSDVKTKNILFKITYNSSINSYDDIFDINLSQDYSVTYKKQNKVDAEKEIFTISNTLQELIRRK